MPIFISYSHQNRDFADRLARQLVQNHVHVWLDRWEFHVGDSLLSKIQDAITGASALLVVLSRASVESAWCQKEINSGLLRELEERRVIVLPVLVEDCRIPIFLREKIHADFRTDFDDGLRTILEAVARITNPNMSRIDGPEYHYDWALDWGDIGDRAMLRITILANAKEWPFSVLSLVEVVADERATRAYKKMVREEGFEKAHTHIIGLVARKVNTPDDLVFFLEDQFARHRDYHITDEDGDYVVHVAARRLGVDTGRAVLMRTGYLLQEALQHMGDVTRQPGP
jgi:hypothetical protein